jgi:DNA-directed RNA polymerase subunit RPC12/RpoP
MSGKVQKCGRCGKRYRNQPGWNADMIAGLVAGVLCPDCQDPQEDLEAELNLVLGRSEGNALDMSDPEAAAEKLINGLVQAYPTPEIMRDKADKLATARSDEQAATMVRSMRQLADDMESGELWEDDESESACMQCGRPAPTTVDEFTTWSVATNTETGEQVGVICPDCRAAHS